MRKTLLARQKRFLPRVSEIRQGVKAQPAAPARQTQTSETLPRSSFTLKSPFLSARLPQYPPYAICSPCAPNCLKVYIIQRRRPTITPSSFPGPQSDRHTFAFNTSFRSLHPTPLSGLDSFSHSLNDNTFPFSLAQQLTIVRLYRCLILGEASRLPNTQTLPDTTRDT